MFLWDVPYPQRYRFEIRMRRNCISQQPFMSYCFKLCRQRREPVGLASSLWLYTKSTGSLASDSLATVLKKRPLAGPEERTSPAESLPLPSSPLARPALTVQPPLRCVLLAGTRAVCSQQQARRIEAVRKATPPPPQSAPSLRSLCGPAPHSIHSQRTSIRWRCIRSTRGRA